MTARDGEARPLTEETMGRRFKHGGTGSTKALHKPLDAMFEGSASLQELLQKLNTWADQELIGGRVDVPPSLRVP